jgi:hypothetical protein
LIRRFPAERAAPFWLLSCRFWEILSEVFLTDSAVCGGLLYFVAFGNLGIYPLAASESRRSERFGKHLTNLEIALQLILFLIKFEIGENNEEMLFTFERLLGLAQLRSDFRRARARFVC